MTRDELIRKNPGLIALSGKDCRDSLVIGAKNIRIELKHAFPGIKFEVKTKRFSGGDDIRVSWTDGPIVEQVRQITRKYNKGSFDGSIDLYTYSNDLWNDVFGGSKYVFENRDFSDDMIEISIIHIAKEYGEKDMPTVADFHSGKANGSPMNDHGDYNRYWDWSSLIHRTASELAF